MTDKPTIIIKHTEILYQEFAQKLRELLFNYNNGRSSSIDIDIATSISDSLHFTLEVGMTVDNNQYDVQELYKIGQKHLKMSLAKCKYLWQKAHDTCIDFGSLAYYDTLENSIPDFFQKYDLNYAANDMTVDIDYPLATLDAYSQKGVLFIQDYLKAFCIENNFILKYPTKTAISFLENYGSKINMDYTNDLVNFFSLLYDNSVFCILAGFPAKQIYLNAKQTEVATIYLQGLSPTELNKIIEEAIQKLILELDINDNITINYILNYGKRYTKTLANALKTDDIKSIIILLEEEAAIPSFVLFRGEQLTDDGLRALTQDIMDCNDVNMKFDILRGATSCMEDFIDVLSANCLFGGEYDLLFNSLDKLELMLLAKAVFGEYDAEIQTKSFWKQSLLNAIKSRN